MKNFKESFMIFLRGLLMGAADVIPGVSGGTIALITGIYERLIKAIDDVNRFVLKDFFHFRLKKAFLNVKKLDFALLVPLLLGIGIAILSLAHLITFLLEEFVAVTFAFFFGLILASAVFVYKHAGKKHCQNIPFLFVGLVVGFLLAAPGSFGTNHSLPIIFLSGAIGICAMILPGISGSAILVLLGQYQFIMESLKSLLFDKIIVFIFGAVVGILSFSKLLDFLLKRHKGSTMAFLTGLMVGSLRRPFDEIVASSPKVIPVIILGVIGFGVVFVLEKYFSE
ncbi:MAG: DUF368 domain-containing protein [Nanoarchaeota archaeon]|nr:DUF368 domain-containing protein [Nanoarchaeota archaeon]